MITSFFKVGITFSLRSRSLSRSLTRSGAILGILEREKGNWLFSKMAFLYFFANFKNNLLRKLEQIQEKIKLRQIQANLRKLQKIYE